MERLYLQIWLSQLYIENEENILHLYHESLLHQVPMKIVAVQVLSDLVYRVSRSSLGTTGNETPIYTNLGLGLCI